MKNLAHQKKNRALRSAQDEGLRVGVTGGIGSGKSTVCELFATLGRTVLSADDIARHLTETNQEIKSSIRKSFGESVFLPNGLVDRKALAAIVFTNHSLRKKLDSIIHPHVFESVEASIASLSPSQRAPYVLVEAALVFESGMDKQLDYVITVVAEENSRVKRVIDRDGSTRDEIVDRMHAQMDPQEKAQLADFVIQNDGKVSELLESVKFFDGLLRTLSKSA